jgi:hypothetical protein
LSRARLLVAIAAGAGVVASAPFMGELRRSIRLAFPGHFVAIVGGVVAVAGICAVGWALVRIRERRAARYGLAALAVGLAAGYARWSALGNPDSDVVELVHFIEYGLVTWLFYRAWQPVGDLSLFVLTFVSAMTVGIFEEWFQWFIPARVGEVRDIGLNSAAILSGMLLGAAVQPPGRLSRPGPRGMRHMALTGAVAFASLSGFVGTVHVGHEIRDPAIGAFRSIHTAEELRSLALERRVRWSVTPPLKRPARLSREDQYASEGLLHVQERNLRWTEGDMATAWRENLILETYFAPVLDAPSYVSATGHRWQPAQRAEAERRGAAPASTATFMSRAHGAFPIFLWPKRSFWILSGGGVAGLLLAGLLLDRWRPAR